MRNEKLTGTGVALITPFKEDCSIDFESLGNLINHLIENGVDYMVVMGTTGESVTLSLAEQNLIIAHAKKIINNRVPIVVGIGGNNTAEVVNRIDSMDFSGIEAILSVSPYYNKPSQKGLLSHYSMISEASPVDVILYNVPSRTSSNIEVKTVSELAEKHDNIIGIKEASGDIAQCMDLVSSCPDGFMIISGDDKMTFPIMSLGGVGVISVQAMAIPQIFTNMVQALLDQNMLLAQSYHYELLKSVDLFYIDGNPSGIKEALYNIGICQSNQVRPPLVKMSRENAARLNDLVKKTINNK
tara:strand:- start:310 stop:1206 length:897 start_codon:yes stop_codon:yes gene_type:complete